MKPFKLRNITGFKVVDPSKPVIIRDKNLRMFYNTEPYLPKVRHFNLPAHMLLYDDSGNFKPLDRPVKYPLDRLPKPERKRKIPNNFKVIFANNPHKCSVHWNEKKIVFDNSFKDMPIQYCMFILFHEFGHHKYSTEHFADMFAKNMMLKRGYNPEQIGESILNTLSNNNFYRKDILIDSL